MSQSLKDFMSEHRGDFDDETPGIHNWSAIEQRIRENQKRKPVLIFRIAAAILFLLASSVALYMVFGKQKGDSPPVSQSQQTTDEFNEWPAEFAAKAKTYNEAIEERQRQLNRLAEKQPELVNQFASDLVALDSAYQVLQRQAQHTPASDVIIKAMIQNLQLQAELLSRQLQILNNYSDQKQYSHEKSDSRTI